ncbi:MAG: hypothetical protein JNK82_18910 [Myxococcaceae bacterium]|nr:hypothetical protein [Myxococcaceae bacterium]
MKLSVVVMSDPKQGDEALGRLFNALALAAEAQRSGDDVELVFQGAGTRWPEELTKLGHPAAGLYDSVRTLVGGYSKGCATVFQAEPPKALCALGENELGADVQVASLRARLADGRQTLVF